MEIDIEQVEMSHDSMINEITNLQKIISDLILIIKKYEPEFEQKNNQSNLNLET